MKQAIPYRITSILLAVFIFISSLGYSLDVHYCGEEVFDFSLIGDISSCTESSNDPTQSRFTNKSCCDLDHFQIDTEDEYREARADQVVSLFHFASTFSICTLSFIENSINEIEIIKRQLPEVPINRDIYVEIESFLL